MDTNVKGISLVLSCTILTSLAQLIYKSGVRPFNLILILVGISIYGFAAVILIIALKGGELSVLYPLISTSYIWVSIFSPMIFPSDSMNTTKWIGIAFIIAGVLYISLGSRKSSAMAKGVL